MTDRPHFTEPYLKSLPRAAFGKRVIHWDGANPGFGIRISDTGVKTFVAQKRLDGRPILVTLGRFTGRNFNAMRKLYDDTVESIGKGRHPTQEKRHAVGTTLADVVADYIDDKLKGKRRGYDVESSLRRDWLGQVRKRERITAAERDANGRILRTKTGSAVKRTRWTSEWIDGPKPFLRNKPVSRITRLDIEARLDEIRAERGSFAARHAMAAIRASLNWAASKARYGMVASPSNGMVDEHVGIDQHNSRRTRVLTDNELRAIWKAASDRGIYGVLVRILMLSGQRLNDWALGRHNEIGDGVLVVPPERYKVKNAHEVPLTKRVIELLHTLPKFEDCPYLFSLDGRNAFSNFYHEKRRIDEASGVTGWTHHDLRRTMRTRMSGLRVLPEVAERVIGHTVGGVRAHYDLHLYREAKLDALTKWEAELLRIVEPNDVIKLPYKRKEVA